jgi:hypothetical protein
MGSLSTIVLILVIVSALAWLITIGSMTLVCLTHNGTKRLPIMLAYFVSALTLSAGVIAWVAVFPTRDGLDFIEDHGDGDRLKLCTSADQDCSTSSMVLGSAGWPGVIALSLLLANCVFIDDATKALRDAAAGDGLLYGDEDLSNAHSSSSSEEEDRVTSEEDSVRDSLDDDLSSSE